MAGKKSCITACMYRTVHKGYVRAVWKDYVEGPEHVIICLFCVLQTIPQFLRRVPAGPVTQGSSALTCARPTWATSADAAHPVSMAMDASAPRIHEQVCLFSPVSPPIHTHPTTSLLNEDLDQLWTLCWGTLPQVKYYFVDGSRPDLPDVSTWIHTFRFNLCSLGVFWK